MTRIQQKLVRQATLFVNHGGKAVTALLRTVLLALAALFELVGLLFGRLEEAVAVNIKDTEPMKSDKVATVTFPMQQPEEPMGRLAAANLVHESPSILTGTVGGRARRP